MLNQQLLPQATAYLARLATRHLAIGAQAIARSTIRATTEKTLQCNAIRAVI